MNLLRKKIIDLYEVTTEQIDSQIEIMQEYLRLRLKMGDLHGIQDSASDERELHAKKACLTKFIEDLFSEEDK